MKRLNLGLFYVIGAYFLWGILPVYWKQLETVPASVTLAYRVFWSLVFLAVVMWLQGKLKVGFVALLNRQKFISRSLAAFLVTINWLTYVWAMGHGYVAESSLGYFICPLLTVFFAALVFKEKLSSSQMYGVAFVTLGVAIKVQNAGQLPWVAIALALSWSLYCTVRKFQASDPISSLLQEVTIIAPLLLVFMLVSDISKLLHWYGNREMFLLLLSGPITAIPILMLVKGLKTVCMSKVAIIQFLTPTLNLFVSIFIGETFKMHDLYVYLPIWMGILIFAGVFKFFVKETVMLRDAAT